MLEQNLFFDNFVRTVRSDNLKNNFPNFTFRTQVIEDRFVLHIVETKLFFIGCLF